MRLAGDTARLESTRLARKCGMDSGEPLLALLCAGAGFPLLRRRLWATDRGDFRAVPQTWVGGADYVSGAPERDGKKKKKKTKSRCMSIAGVERTSIERGRGIAADAPEHIASCWMCEESGGGGGDVEGCVSGTGCEEPNAVKLVVRCGRAGAVVFPRADDPRLTGREGACVLNIWGFTLIESPRWTSLVAVAESS